MTISLNGTSSRRVRIQRGSPQGSVLGCFLYCATTQRLSSNVAAGRRVRDGPRGSSGEEEGVIWYDVNRRPPKPFLYVDDTTLYQAAPMASASRHLTTHTTREELGDLELGVAFTKLENDAKEIGMRINGRKTQLLVISPPNGCITTASLKTTDGVTVESQSSLKLVGFTFGDTPGAVCHVAGIKDRYRRKVWMLYHWRRSGLTGDQLFKLYCCHVRSIIEYCSAVYHSLLTKRDAEDLERLHRNAVRICYGFDPPIELTFASNGIETLETRRIRRWDNFIKKAASNPRFHRRWFPARPEAPQNLRRRRGIVETMAASQRKFDSPLAFMRRRANEIGVSAYRG